MKISITVTKEELLAAKELNGTVVKENYDSINGNKNMYVYLPYGYDGSGNSEEGGGEKTFLVAKTDSYTATFKAGREGSAVIEYDISESLTAKFYKFQGDNLLDIFSVFARLSNMVVWLSENKRKLRIFDKIVFGGALKDIALRISKLKAAWNKE